MDFNENDHKQPYSIESEQAVLGAILLDPDKISVAAENLKPDSFYFQKHREIFETMTEMFNMTIPSKVSSFWKGSEKRAILKTTPTNSIFFLLPNRLQ